MIREGRLLAGVEVVLKIEERARAGEEQIEIGRVGDVAERAGLGAEPHVVGLAA
jgi:hypothetical protein